jgi:hypothetical protein
MLFVSPASLRYFMQSFFLFFMLVGLIPIIVLKRNFFVKMLFISLLLSAVHPFFFSPPHYPSTFSHPSSPTHPYLSPFFLTSSFICSPTSHQSFLHSPRPLFFISYCLITNHSCYILLGNKFAHIYYGNSLLLAISNVRSLHSNHSQLASFISSNSPDILCLTEVWTKSVDISPYFNDFPPDTFCFNHNPRLSRGGGTAIITKSSIPTSNHQCPPFPTFELTASRLTLSQGPILIVCLYRPPNPRPLYCPFFLTSPIFSITSLQLTTQSLLSVISTFLLPLILIHL